MKFCPVCHNTIDENPSTCPHCNSMIGEPQTVRRLVEYVPVDRKLYFAVAVPCLISWFFFLISVFGLARYGYDLFIFNPLTCPIMTSLILGWKDKRPLSDLWGPCLAAGLLCSWCLILFGFEGLICLFIFTPLHLLIILCGTLLGYLLQGGKWLTKRTALACVVIANPLVLGVEDYMQLENAYHTQEDRVVVQMNKDELWQKLNTPMRFGQHTSRWYRNGFTYPKTAAITKIKGETYLKCELSNGAIEMPVIVDKANDRIIFSPTVMPEPMKELTFYKHIDAPHLHDYFKIQNGSIQLIKLDDKRTEVVARSTYRYDIWPQFYWRPITEKILSKMHRHVLKYFEHEEARS